MNSATVRNPRVTPPNSNKSADSFQKTEVGYGKKTKLGRILEDFVAVEREMEGTQGSGIWGRCTIYSVEAAYDVAWTPKIWRHIIN